MRILTAIVISWASALAAIPTQNKSADWKNVSACGLSFSLPSDIKEEKVQGIDSCVHRYRGKNSLLILDAIMYVNIDGSRKDEYAGKRDFNWMETKIDRQKAEIISCYDAVNTEARRFNYVAVLYVPRMPKDQGNLTIWTYSKSPEEREKAIKIFESVRFSSNSKTRH